MPLNLDLAPSKAKLARAREHSETLVGEAREAIKKQATHTVHITPVDPESGWHTITMTPEKIDEPRLSVLLGDVIHNLRSALDYLIPPLVEASEAKLSTKHEFPIFLHARDYAATVGTKTKAKTGGPLKHVTHGLAVVADWQPYKRTGDPETDPLWGIHRFSNADKHRQLTRLWVRPIGRTHLSVQHRSPDSRARSDRRNQRLAAGYRASNRARPLQTRRPRQYPRSRPSRHRRPLLHAVLREGEQALAQTERGAGPRRERQRRHRLVQAAVEPPLRHHLTRPHKGRDE